MENNQQAPQSPASSSNDLSPARSPPANTQTFLDLTTTNSTPSHPITAKTPNNNIVPDVVTNSGDTKIATPDTKPKKPRKRKLIETTGDAKNDEQTPKEKKPRKPRNSNVDGTAPRKKQKTVTAENKDGSPSASAQNSKAPTMAEMMAPHPTLQTSNTGNNISKPEAALSTPIVASRPISSGQIYDPIRGFTIEALPVTSTPNPSTSSPPVPRTNGSASLANLMNPVDTSVSTIIKRTQATDLAAPKAPLFTPKNSSGELMNASGKLVHSEATPPKQIPKANSPNKPQSETINSSSSATVPPVLQNSNVIDLADHGTTSKPPSAAGTPKARQSPTRPLGSGLLSGSGLLGGNLSDVDEANSRQGVDITLDIVLNPNGQNTINIAQEIMKKYGRDAINPRAAAHRDRLLQVAAAADRLERGSDDVSSVTGSDDENESNLEMEDIGDGATDANSSNNPVKKRRRQRIEEYDKEDDFIDDAEMAWEESAAVAKDGFFVYSGPLVKPSEKIVIERYV